MKGSEKDIILGMKAEVICNFIIEKQCYELGIDFNGNVRMWEEVDMRIDKNGVLYVKELEASKKRDEKSINTEELIPNFDFDNRVVLEIDYEIETSIMRMVVSIRILEPYTEEYGRYGKLIKEHEFYIDKHGVVSPKV